MLYSLKHHPHVFEVNIYFHFRIAQSNPLYFSRLRNSCKQDRMECFERIFQFEDIIRNEKKTVTVTEVVNIRIQQNS